MFVARESLNTAEMRWNENNISTVHQLIKSNLSGYIDNISIGPRLIMLSRQVTSIQRFLFHLFYSFGEKT